MKGKTPHIVQYQGSKRKLASSILKYMPERFRRLAEPFSGMAAVSIASASEHRADSYIINDINEPLVKILEEAVNRPKQLSREYRTIWEEQFTHDGGSIQHFYHVRELFNSGGKSPANLLYLLARCVKGSVRYSREGRFNQSPDKRRHGTHPDTLEQNIHSVSCLLKGRAEFFALDYREILDMLRPGDLVYMDPPYQGVTGSRDNRYLSGVNFAELAEALETLNRRGIDYLISYDGSCGGKEYGESLPESLGCTKILLNAGLSSQATLLGRKSETFEALYISRSLNSLTGAVPRQLTFMEIPA
ncbi:MAG: DNA adenine methylase [Synergistaceae bacterium]|nr:DNA adenine methylase [Synergistaceae bacterium]